jgi:hypothetical protein
MTWTYILVTIHPSFVMTSHLIDNCGVFLTNSSKQSLCFSGANIMVLKYDCAVHKCIFRVDLKFTKMLRRQRFAVDPNGRADNDYASGYFPGFMDWGGGCKTRSGGGCGTGTAELGAQSV